MSYLHAKLAAHAKRAAGLARQRHRPLRPSADHVTQEIHTIAASVASLALSPQHTLNRESLSALSCVAVAQRRIQGRITPALENYFRHVAQNILQHRALSSSDLALIGTGLSAECVYEKTVLSLRALDLPNDLRSAVALLRSNADSSVLVVSLRSAALKLIAAQHVDTAPVPSELLHLLYSVAATLHAKHTPVSVLRFIHRALESGVLAKQLQFFDEMRLLAKTLRHLIGVVETPQIIQQIRSLCALLDNTAPLAAKPGENNALYIGQIVLSNHLCGVDSPALFKHVKNMPFLLEKVHDKRKPLALLWHCALWEYFEGCASFKSRPRGGDQLVSLFSAALSALKETPRSCPVERVKLLVVLSLLKSMEPHLVKMHSTALQRGLRESLVGVYAPLKKVVDECTQVIRESEKRRRR